MFHKVHMVLGPNYNYLLNASNYLLKISNYILGKTLKAIKCTKYLLLIFDCCSCNSGEDSGVFNKEVAVFGAQLESRQVEGKSRQGEGKFSYLILVYLPPIEGGVNPKPSPSASHCNINESSKHQLSFQHYLYHMKL